jgi:hypothetical protein
MLIPDRLSRKEECGKSGVPPDLPRVRGKHSPDIATTSVLGVNLVITPYRLRMVYIRCYSMAVVNSSSVRKRHQQFVRSESERTIDVAEKVIVGLVLA